MTFDTLSFGFRLITNLFVHNATIALVSRTTLCWRVFSLKSCDDLSTGIHYETVIQYRRQPLPSSLNVHRVGATSRLNNGVLEFQDFL